MFNKIFKRSQPDTNPPSNAPESSPTPETSTEAPAVETPAASPADAAAVPEPAAPPLETPPPPPTPNTPPSSQPQPPLYPPLPLRRKRGLLYFLFSPETGVGRVMRPVLRWLGAITGLFALGLLVGYLLLYQPTQRSLDAALANLVMATQTAAQQGQSQQAAVADRNQAQAAYQTAQAALTKAASENKLLTLLIDVSNARVALVNKDGATAKTAIQQAQTDLTGVLPFLQSQDKTRSDVIQTRLNLVAQELVSDPQATLSDLDKLSADLTDLHKKLFPQ